LGAIHTKTKPVFSGLDIYLQPALECVFWGISMGENTLSLPPPYQLEYIRPALLAVGPNAEEE
jgi:hypothetical protein